jgi:AraC-like DNA-binding protein
MGRRLQSPSPVVNAHVLVRQAVGLQLLGIDVRPALECIQLTPGDLEKLAHEIPVRTVTDFWEATVRMTGQSGLGLRLAQYVRPESYEVFGCLIAASATLGNAALRATRLIGLVTQSVSFSLHCDGQRASLSVEPLYPELLHREAIEFMVGAVHVIGRRITGRVLTPIEVRFTHAAPADTSHHQRLFAAPIRFGAPSNTLVFESKLLDLPLQSHDSSLCAALERQADELLGREPAHGFKAEVRAALAAELRGGDPSAEHVAVALAVHPKTLARRLRAEGTTFRRVVDELRLQLAERYLRQPGLSVEEVAFLLGYSDHSAFHRAFRRWTGRAPRASDA